MQLTRFSLLPLLAACATLPTKEACADLTTPPVVACFGGDTLDWPGYGTLEMDVEATVVSVGTGPRPDTCAVDVGNDLFEQGLVVELESADGARYTVGLTVPEMSGTLVAVGDTLSVSAAYTFGEFGPNLGVVRLEKAGTTVVLVATGGELTDLPDDLDASEGAVRCTEDDGCGVYSKYDLNVQFGGDSTSVLYGESATLGAARVVHGGYEQAAPSQGGTCPDWYVAHVTLAVVVE